MIVQVIALRGADFVVAEALAGADSAPNRDAGPRSLWTRSGLRTVYLPEADARALRQRLLERTPAITRGAGAADTPVIAGVREQQVQQGALWGELVRGPSLPSRTVGLHDNRLPVGPFPLRLLARCWIIPDAPAGADDAPGAALRIEIVPQVLEGRPREAGFGDAPAPRLAHEQGLTLWRLRGGLTIPRGQALVIVAEDPGVSWESRAAEAAQARADAKDPRPREPGPLRPGQVSARADDPAPPLPDEAPDAAAGPESAAAPGPFSGAVRSLGEDILNLPAPVDPDAPTGAGAAPGSGARLVIFIFPSIPAEYSLIGAP
jgi:hypothetical protein